MGCSEPALEPAGWAARLQLGFERRGPRTVLARRCHEGPLVVQRPFYPEGEASCHVYLLHPPGGVVGGDRLTLEAELGAGAQVLLTTPSAGKFYRSPTVAGSQVQLLRIGTGAALEWLPQESIVFDGARFSGLTRVELAADAAFIGWEVLCLGRPAAAERFTHGEGRQRFELWREGEPLWLERARYPGGAPVLDEPWGLQGQPVTGTLVAVGGDTSLLRRLREALDGVRGDGRFVLTQLPQVIVCRYLGADTAHARAGFVLAWQILRQALWQRPACLPRIWNT